MSDTAEASAAVIRLPARGQEDRDGVIRGNRIGTVVSWKDGVPLVDFQGNPHGPLAARLLDSVKLSPVAPEQNRPCEVLLAFQEERIDLPVIVGIVKPLPAPTSGLETEAALSSGPVVAKIDGRRVTLTAEDEIELRCGEASIVLRRNGRVVIRGMYVEARSRGTNRIRGSTVEIN